MVAPGHRRPERGVCCAAAEDKSWDVHMLATHIRKEGRCHGWLCWALANNGIVSKRRGAAAADESLKDTAPLLFRLVDPGPQQSLTGPAFLRSNLS